VDENIDGPELRGHLFEDACRCVLLREIRNDSERLTAGLLHVPYDAVQLRGGSRGDADLGAGLSERDGNGLADAASGAGDQGDAILQGEHKTSWIGERRVLSTN